MPNWCDNSLEVKGSPRELAKMVRDVEITASEATSTHDKSLFSCQRIIPRPVDKDTDWYDWNVNNWGSKWDISDPYRGGEEGDKVVYYSFQTAWSPIVPVITALAKKYPKLEFLYQYSETGSDFWGEHTFKKGEETSVEGGAFSDASCEKQQELIGNHHYCPDCGNEIPCEEEHTSLYCEDCEEERSNEDSKLWEGEVSEVS